MLAVLQAGPGMMLGTRANKQLQNGVPAAAPLFERGSSFCDLQQRTLVVFEGTVAQRRPALKKGATGTKFGGARIRETREQQAFTHTTSARALRLDPTRHAPLTASTWFYHASSYQNNILATSAATAARATVAAARNERDALQHARRLAAPAARASARRQRGRDELAAGSRRCFAGAAALAGAQLERQRAARALRRLGGRPSLRRPPS